jgi:predicted small lipoprotein YifL
MPQRLKTALIILTLAAIGIGIGGCGQKGDLYLPDETNGEQRQ